MLSGDDDWSRSKETSRNKWFFNGDAPPDSSCHRPDVTEKSTLRVTAKRDVRSPLLVCDPCFRGVMESGGGLWTMEYGTINLAMEQTI
jgi:hypothetical protein